MQVMHSIAQFCEFGDQKFAKLLNNVFAWVVRFERASQVLQVLQVLQTVFQVLHRVASFASLRKFCMF